MARRPLLRVGLLAAMVLSAWGQVTVAVQPVSAPATAAEQEALQSLTVRFQDRLAQQLVKLPIVSLMDRQHIVELLREQNFAIPVSMDRTAADSIGRILRVDVIILVSFYPLQNAGLFSRLAGEKRWTASGEFVEVSSSRVLGKSVCGAVSTEAEILSCAQQLAREFQPAAGSLWSMKQQQVKTQAEGQQQQAKAQGEAQSLASARLLKDEEQQRAARQERVQAMGVEAARATESLQRERTEEARLSLQRMEEQRAQQETAAKLDAELELARTHQSDLVSEANSMLDYWARFERELHRQGGAALRSEIRTAVARLRADVSAIDDCLKRRLLKEAASNLEKAQNEIDALEQMK